MYKTFLVKIDWLNGTNHGHSNGYVALSENHPYHGKDYDYIPVDVHGGLTFARIGSNCDKNRFPGLEDNEWLVGFDTAHCDDTMFNWPEEAVREETNNLARQLEELAK